MANNPQFKVSQLAKDLNIKNKDIMDMLAGSGITVKSAQTALEPAQFDILFETLTRNNQIDSIDKYMSGETYIPSKKPKALHRTALRFPRTVAAEHPTVALFAAVKRQLLFVLFLPRVVSFQPVARLPPFFFSLNRFQLFDYLSHKPLRFVKTSHAVYFIMNV